MSFRLNIRVSGTYVRLAGIGRAQPITLALRLGTMPSPSFNERLFSFTGTLDASGLARGVPITGTLRLSDWRRPRIEYASTFTSDQGDPYQLHGIQALHLRSFVRPSLALDAEISAPQGTLIGRCRLHARWLPRWPF